MVAGYLAKNPDGSLSMQTWNGFILGQAQIVSSWKLPVTCFISDRMYQIEAKINGIVYTGRGTGIGMAWRGKPKSNNKFSEFNNFSH